MLARTLALLASIALVTACDLPTPKAPPRAPADEEIVVSEPARPVARPTARGELSYTLSFPNPHTHYMEVEARVPTNGQPHVVMTMAVWTPGSYLVREFSRHVEGLEALGEGGRPLPLRQIRKNRWQIDTRGADHVTLNYRIYCREMTVRTNWVESSFAMINGAPTFISLAGAKSWPHNVRIVPHRDWIQSHTGLPAHPDGAPHHYRAEDFDALVDSPIIVGNPAVERFEAAGKPHLLVDAGLIHGDDRAVWDSKKAAADVARIVETQAAFWGGVPYDKYLFFNVLSERGGGLEHRNSTLMMTSLWTGRRHEDYIGWLGLVSHEFFHTWNVKRLRPEALGPFDYERENYTPSLWVAEGVTSYYDDLLLRRAGLLTDEEYLERISKSIERTESRPGRHVQSLSASSFNAWIKHYRPDENSDNTAVSYYTRGSIAALLLDMQLREATADQGTLDDVMRLAYRRYSGEVGYTAAQFRALVDEVAGKDMSPFFRAHIDGTQPFDYRQAMAWLGLRFKPLKRSEDAKDPERGWLGLHTKVKGGLLVVSKVERDTPAWRMGVNVGDELIALDGHRVTPKTLGKVKTRYLPGDPVTALVTRRARLVHLDGTFAEKPRESWTVELDPKATPAQQARRARWLGEAR